MMVHSSFAVKDVFFLEGQFALRSLNDEPIIVVYRINIYNYMQLNKSSC